MVDRQTEFSVFSDCGNGHQLHSKSLFFSPTEREASTTVSFQQAPSRLVKKHAAGEVFGNSDEETEKDDHGERRKRLFRHDDETEKKRQSAELKKQQAKKLIESIPTKKEELFAYPVSWNVLDKVC